MTWTMTVRAKTEKGRLAIQKELVEKKKLKMRERAAYWLLFEQEVKPEPFTLVLRSKNQAVASIKPEQYVKIIAVALAKEGCDLNDYEVVIDE